ncbi:MAG: hypothetical protein IT364_13900 [Candidatus Hydrogenedentes bacterium]|nr:hypothetical protein [Candidatus Hydrogenedentota bacterium]
MAKCRVFAVCCRLVLLAVLALAAKAAEDGEAGFLERAIPSESGFDGAVAIVERVVDAEDPGFGYVTAEIPYLDIYGNPRKGQGRLFVRKADVESGKPVPAFCHVHYEKGVDGGKKISARGWAVATPHYGDPAKGEYPLELCTADSNNLSRALIQWVRRLPFIDGARLHLDGGSAGGYMSLAMSAEFFPVSATTADAPVCNWAYNVNYLDANKKASGFPPPAGQAPDLKKSPLPVLFAITGLADQSTGVFGADLSAEAYYLISPIACLDRITSPVLIQCATGDMLVPHEQMTASLERPIDRALFPESYVRDFDTLTLCEKARKRFDELVPKDQLAFHLIPLPEGMHEYTLANFLKEEKEPPSPPEIDRPWDPQKQWNIAVFDEGPPKPFSAHTRYKWGSSSNAFIEAHRTPAPAPSILNAAKLDRLMQRYAGELKDEPLLASTGKPANRLNVAAIEKLDVVSGLLAYADLGEAHTSRLTELYAGSTLKPLGAELNLDQLREERASLRKELGLP